MAIDASGLSLRDRHFSKFLLGGLGLIVGIDGDQPDDG